MEYQALGPVKAVVTCEDKKGKEGGIQEGGGGGVLRGYSRWGRVQNTVVRIRRGL